MSTISSEQAEQIMQLFVDRFIRKDYDAMLDLFDEDVIFEFPYIPNPNPKQFKIVRYQDYWNPLAMM